MLQDLLLNFEIVVDGAGQKKRALLPWAIWEALLDYVKRTEESDHTLQYFNGVQHKFTKPDETWATGLSGIWKDDRPAEEIANEIISARTPGREMPAL